VGGNLILSIYGSRNRRIPFNYWTGNMVTIRMQTTNAYIAGDFMLRLKPLQGPVQPYLDGLIGFNNLSTTTQVEDENDWFDDEDEEIASTTNMSDSAFSYGLGGGVLILIIKPKNPEEEFRGNVKIVKKSLGVFLDFGVRYLIGGEAHYLNVNKDGWMTATDPADGPVVTTFYPDRSKTDVFTIHLGIVIPF